MNMVSQDSFTHKRLVSRIKMPYLSVCGYASKLIRYDNQLTGGNHAT